MTTAIAVLADYEDLPSRAGSAARVLTLADAPDTTASDLAKAIGTDPAFTARVISLANSAYYGLSGRVGTLHYAISVIGFQTIRSIAVALAAGLDKPDAVPGGFWEQAATSATAANLLAPRLGANPGDAFSVGLLHTIGSALLHQHRPLPALCLPFPDDLDALDAAELELYGIGHAAAGARVLAAWHFPERLCSVIADHHAVPLPNAAPLERTLHAARALSDLVLHRDDQTHNDPAHDQARDQAHDRSTHALIWLSEGKLSAQDIDPLVDQLLEHSSTLLSTLRAR